MHFLYAHFYMDHGILWLERFSSWMENKKDPSFLDPSLIDLRQEWTKTTQETDSLLQTSTQLQTAFSQIQERFSLK